MLPTRRPPTHPGEMLLKEFLEPLDVSDRSGEPHERPLPATQRNRKGPPQCKRRHCAPARGPHGLGRPGLADAAGEVRPVACHEGSREPTEGPTPTQDRIDVSAAALHG